MSILNSFVEYNRIYWKNKKAGGTPTGATNFNIMDKGIKANNEAIAELNDVKLDKSEVPTTVAQLTDSTDYAKKTDLPNNTNQLTNGAGFITKSNGVSIHTGVSSNILTNFRTELGFGNGNQPVSTLRTNENIDGMCQYSPGIAFETGDTHGYLNVNFDIPKAYIGGGNGQGIIWYDEVVLKNHIGADWLPSNGISIDDLPNGAYSTNPNVLPNIGIPSGLSEYGTLILNKTPEYDSIIFHDIFGRLAVYNTHEGKWTIFVSTENLATTTKDGLMSATDKQKLDNIGEIEFEKTTIFSGVNFLSEDVPMDRFLGYDFVYIETGGTPLTTSNDVFRYNADKSYLIPGMVFDEFEQYHQNGIYIFNDSDNDNIFLQYNKILSNPSYVSISHASADKWFGIWGIKIKGETASNVGGKVLAIQTDTTASTYQISGNADTTPLMLETVAYGSDGSVKAIASNYCYVNGSDVKNLPMTTSLSNTYGVVTTHSSGVIQVSNKEGYKLKVWITGSGYNVTKQ